MLKRKTLTQIGLGLLGAAVLAVGGGRVPSPPATRPARHPRVTQRNSRHIGRHTGRCRRLLHSCQPDPPLRRHHDAGFRLRFEPGVGSDTVDPVSAGPSRHDRATPRGATTDPLGAFLAAVNQALSSTPLGTLVPQATGARASGPVRRCDPPSAQTGATVTPDSSGTGSHVGLVGVPGTTGSLTNLGL